MDAQRIGGMIGWVGKCMDEWKCVQKDKWEIL